MILIASLTVCVERKKTRNGRVTYFQLVRRRFLTNQNEFNKYDRRRVSAEQGGRTRLPKFKFSAKFPIGLHVISQIQIRQFENDCYIM